MDIQKLHAVALAMVALGKGILAADESNGTCGKRFEKIGVENTEDNRRAYREMLFTAPGIGEHISGVIMYDETIRQSAADGRTFVKVLQDAGVLPGIKVDLGTKEMDGSPEEKITKGLEGLPERLAEYFSLGATFCKWRAVITIGEGLPTDANIRENAKILATYAKMCQDAGLVPMVEPEVLMDWSHGIDVCRDATKRTLMAVFEELEKAGVAVEGMILKPNMVISGKESGVTDTSEVVAKATLDLFNEILPAHLAGISFLSGGQSETQATENLNALNSAEHHWPLSFSYGRALQNSALQTWGGKAENVVSAQQVLWHTFWNRAQKLLGVVVLGGFVNADGVVHLHHFAIVHDRDFIQGKRLCSGDAAAVYPAKADSGEFPDCFYEP